MKIIQVVGLANSGKTTFIKDLIPALSSRGKVAVIKHLGDHEFFLEEGKDTTGFFEAGAAISAGVDSHKSILAIRNDSLDDLLTLFYWMGIDFAVLEGFKKRDFPKIVIGDLSIDMCVLKNPEIREVISSLDLFKDFENKNEN